VKSSKSGANLAYRQGYYARAEGATDQKAELQEAACQDLLVVAKAYPGDQPGTVKYFMAIDPTTLTFAPQPDGLRELALRVGVCTFDKSGKPMQFLQDLVDAKLSDKQFAAIQAQHGFPHSIVFTPGPGTASVRLLVKDAASGEMGSVNVPNVVAAIPATRSPTGGASTLAPPPSH